MTSNIFLRRPAAGALTLAALLASAAGAQAAISVTDASIAGGKLVVSGTTSSGAQIRLDGQEGAAFNAKAGVDGAFSFSLVYHPGDCVVTLESLVPPYLTAGESTDALVGDCGPAGVTAKGAWRQSATYVRNDLVTHDGSTWRARRNNAGRTPAGGADWEVFAAAGESELAEAAAAGSLRVPPTGPAGGDLQGTYPNPQIRNLVIVASNLASDSVTSPKINDGGVKFLDLDIDVIDSSKVIDNTLRSADILDNTLLSADVADGAITGADIQNESIGVADLGIDSVQALEIADDSIDSGEIVDNSLFSADLGLSSVRGSELGAIIRRSATSGLIAANGFGNVGVACLAGERVIAGGNDTSDAANVVVVASRDDGNGWRVFVRNFSGGTRTVTTHAYCLQAS